MNPAGAARKPTLKDVAHLAGVSPMTASRVVAGREAVTPDLAKRVQQAVKKLGYSRNEAARLMRPGQLSGLLGVIVTNIDNPYYAQVLLGIEAAAKRAGRLIITGVSHNDPALEAQLATDLAARRVEGLIVVPASADAPHLSRMAASGLPIVLASRSIRQRGADTVLVDDVGGVKAALAPLLDEGTHPIAFIGGPDSITTAARRHDGFVEAHVEAGVAVREDLVVRLEPEPAAVAAATRDLLDNAAPPRAIFTTNNRYTTSVLRVLLEERHRWDDPADYPPLVGFDSFELADLIPYPLLMIDHDPHALGVLAAELALRRIDGATATPPVTITLPSVGDVRGGSWLGR